MLYERYSGIFASRDGILWKAVIMQESDRAFSTVGELAFPAEEPLIIEWGETDKDEPVASSSATLTLLSPGDRTYEDLYTIEVGRIRLDVYRNGVLYWSGVLDPEFYEEPYISNSDYEVSLTFSDFGILDRLKYGLSGRQNCYELLTYILQASRISYQSIESHISTTLAGSGNSGLAQFDVRSDNFFDEDGEASTLREVLDGILQPLALRIQQRNGKIWVYDLNCAFSELRSRKIEWTSDDQVMGVDKVVNNAKIKLSTYSSAELLTDELTYPGEYSEDMTNITNDDKGYFSFYTDYSESNRVDWNWDYNLISFTIFLDHNYDRKETGLKEVAGSARYFHIQPMLGGQEATGVMAFMRTQGHGSLTTGWPRKIGIDPSYKQQTVLMRSNRVFIPKIDSAEASKYYVRLQLEMLLDARYNPFTDANDGNESGNYNNLKVWFGYVMIPVTVTLYDESGTAIKHYSNETIARSSDRPGHLSWTKGEWKNGAATFGSCWLEWYDPNDRSENSGCLGWKKNRHNIGLSTKPIYKSFAQMDEGEYIPYPPEGGYLEVCVYIGIYPWDYGETDFDTHRMADRKNLYEKIRWLLYKAPSIDVVKSNVVKSDAETDDIEYYSYINVSAKDDLDIDTICGTAENPCPTSKANFLNAGTGQQVSVVTRAGRTSQAERLLLGTLYSQFAERKTKLEGTAQIPAGDLTLYSDAMQGDKKFLCMSEVQNLQAGESEITVVELRPDEYDEEIL